MNNIIKKINSENIYFQKDDFTLILGDSIELLKRIKINSIDMLFADPPYFLSNGGITCNSGMMVSVDKADWDKIDGIREMHKFNKKWLKQCQRILKPDGTIWISGTMHNIYSVGLALQELDYKLLNNIIWFKPNAPPNLSCKYFTHSTETIIWAAKNNKSKHLYNYKEMKSENGNKQMRDVWTMTAPKACEKKFGKVPVQKPLDLLKRIISASTKEGYLILDPFNGSGTTGIAAVKLNRKYIGIDNVEEYLQITKMRYSETVNIMKLSKYYK